MKKFLYSLIGLGALLITAGCQQEKNFAANDEGIAEVTFTVGLEGLGTKAEANYSTGTGASKLEVMVYNVTSGTPALLPNVSKTITGAFGVGDLVEAVSVKLVKGQTYNILFWAQNPASTAYTLDKNAGTITVDPGKAASPIAANDETRDAFFGVVAGYAVTGSFAESVELKRPFAQINVLDRIDDWNAALDNGIVFAGSSMTVDAPTILDLLSGEATEPATYYFGAAAVDYDNPNIAGYGDDSNGAHYKYIAMNYILAGAKATADVDFSVYNNNLTTELFPFSVPSVPYQRNYRTNIIGDIFSCDGIFNVIIVPAYDGENNVVIGGCATPTFSPAAGAVEAGTTVTIATTTEDAEIYYTTDGTNPTSASTKYTAAIAINEAVTIKAIAIKDGLDDSAVATAAYTIAVPVLEDVATPTFNPAAGEVAAGTTVAISCTTAGASILYSTDGSAPSLAYTEPIAVNEALTIKAIAKKDGMNDSAVASAAYTIAAAPAPAGSTIAELKALITAANTTFEAPVTLGTVIVTAVKGSNVWLEDNSGAILLYLSGHELEAGKSYTGAKVTKGTFYNTLYEITDFDITDATVADAEIPVTEITIAQLNENFLNYESRRVKLSGVNVATEVVGTDKTVPVTKGEATTNLYIRYEQALKVESVLDVIGNVSKFSGNIQIAVFADTDVTVVTPGITTTKITGLTNKTIVKGESFDFSTAVSTNAGSIVYNLSETTGVSLDGSTVSIDANAEVGATATLTASVTRVDGDHTAAVATATITVGAAGSGPSLYVDTITYSLIGVTGTSYTEWSNKAGSASEAIYAGQSAGGYEAIQLRSNNSNSGIVSTTTGGNVKKVEVVWNTNTAATREVEIYVSNTAFTSPTQLYNVSGDTIVSAGTINVDNSSTSVEITGNYKYVGIRSKSGALYLESVKITWEK